MGRDTASPFFGKNHGSPFSQISNTLILQPTACALQLNLIVITQGVISSTHDQAISIIVVRNKMCIQFGATSVNAPTGRLRSFLDHSLLDEPFFHETCKIWSPAGGLACQAWGASSTQTRAFLRGVLARQIRYAESPVPEPSEGCPGGFKRKIYSGAQKNGIGQKIGSCKRTPDSPPPLNSAVLTAALAARMVQICDFPGIPNHVEGKLGCGLTKSFNCWPPHIPAYVLDRCHRCVPSQLR